MQLRADQLATHLARGLQPVYTIHGDEPLLAQEAGDAIRNAARDAGYVERKVFTVAAHFDWSGLLGAAQAMSLFASRHDAALGGWLRLGGAAMVGLGLVLIVVRSRMRR